MPLTPSNCRRIVPALTNGSVLHAGTFDLASKAKLLTANLPHNPPDLNPEIHGSASAAPLVSRSPPRPFFDLLSLRSPTPPSHATLAPWSAPQLLCSSLAASFASPSSRLPQSPTSSPSHVPFNQNPLVRSHHGSPSKFEQPHAQRPSPSSRATATLTPLVILTCLLLLSVWTCCNLLIPCTSRPTCTHASLPQHRPPSHAHRHSVLGNSPAETPDAVYTTAEIRFDHPF